MIRIFRHNHLRQQSRARRAPFNRLRRLACRLHRAGAGVLLTNVFDHHQLRRNVFVALACFGAELAHVTISNRYRRHRHQEFLRFLNEIENNLPTGLDVHLVMDDHGTHKVAKVRSWFARHPRYHVHFTPTSASWLNLVERLFAEVTERCVRRGSHTAVRMLEHAMLNYLDHRNKNPKPFLWTADADLILGKIERLCNAFLAQDTNWPERID